MRSIRGWVPVLLVVVAHAAAAAPAAEPTAPEYVVDRSKTAKERMQERQHLRELKKRLTAPVVPGNNADLAFAVARARAASQALKDRQRRRQRKAAQPHHGATPPAIPPQHLANAAPTRQRGKPAKAAIAPTPPAAVTEAAPVTVPVAAAAVPPASAATVAGTPRSYAVPKGFEAWSAPQKTMVDLYYGGRFMVSTLAEYTLDNVTLLNPAEVTARLPQLRDADATGALLARPLATHADKVCARSSQGGCGLLETGDIGLIFDERRFRADLFVGPALLRDASTASQQYLPPPAYEAPTLVQNLSALYTGGGEESHGSLFGRTRLGLGDGGYGFANWASTDQQGMHFDEAGYRRDTRDLQISAGLFLPASDMLVEIPQDPIAGASVMRSLLTRTDLASLNSSPITLFLPLRSNVDIYRDGRLVSTGFYEAGNQAVDTSSLPSGIYNVDVVIKDVGGGTRTVRQLFIKTATLAPPDTPLWFVDAGRVLQRNSDSLLPEDHGASRLRAGYRWRQTPWLGFGGAAALTDREGLLEVSTTLVSAAAEGGGQLFADSDGSSGYGLRALTHWRQLVASAYAQQTRTGDDTVSNPAEYHLLPRGQSLTTLSLSYPVWQGLLSAYLTDRRDEGLPPGQQETLEYIRAFPLPGNQSLRFRVQAGRDTGNNFFLAGLQWQSLRGAWQHSAEAQHIQNDTPGAVSGNSASVATKWRSGDRFARDVEAGVSASVNDSNRSLTLEAQDRSQYGHGSAFVTAADADGTRQTLTSLAYEASLVVGERGQVSWGGGPLLNDSAALLDLRNAEPDTRFELDIEQQKALIVRGGGLAAVTLPPYHRYHLQIRDSGDTLAASSNPPQEVALYPGQVSTLNWNAYAIRVLIGRALTEDGKPLANARIDGGEDPVMTDDDGYFQAEVARSVSTLRAHSGDEFCRIALPEPVKGESVVRASALVCVKVSPPPEVTLSKR